MYHEEMLIIGDGSCSRCSKMFYTYSRTGIQVCKGCANLEESNDSFENEFIKKPHFMVS